MERLEEALLKVSSMSPSKAHFCFMATSFRAKSGCWLHWGWKSDILS